MSRRRVRVAAAVVLGLLALWLLGLGVLVQARADAAVAERPSERLPAVDCGPFKWTDPITPGGGCPPPNPLDPAQKAAFEWLCPPKVAPEPQMPGGYETGPSTGGLWQTYRFAGLRWTTFDQGCQAQWADGMATDFNNVVNQLDEMVAESMGAAVDPGQTSAFDPTLTAAVTALRDAFWQPWLAVGLAGAGAFLALAAAMGRFSDAGAIGTNLVLVLVGVTLVVTNPTLIPAASDKLTVEVAAKSSAGLLKLTGQQGTVGAYPAAYHSLAYQSTIRGAFCGDVAAARKFGPRLVAAQAYSVPEARTLAVDPGKVEKIREAKGRDWLKIADELKADYPGAYACWSGQAGSRWGPASLHAVVSVLAGLPVAGAALAILVLKDLLRWVLLLVVALGALLLMARRMTSTVLGLAVFAAIGAPIVTLAASTMLYGYVVILADPYQPWWRSVMGAVALVVAVVVSLPFLARGVTGLALLVAWQRSGTRMRRQSMRRYYRRNGGGGGGGGSGSRGRGGGQERSGGSGGQGLDGSPGPDGGPGSGDGRRPEPALSGAWATSHPAGDDRWASGGPSEPVSGRTSSADEDRGGIGAWSPTTGYAPRPEPSTGMPAYFGVGPSDVGRSASDARFSDLRESGYTGWIDQDGEPVDDLGQWADSHRPAEAGGMHPSGWYDPRERRARDTDGGWGVQGPRHSPGWQGGRSGDDRRPDA